MPAVHRDHNALKNVQKKKKVYYDGQCVSKSYERSRRRKKMPTEYFEVQGVSRVSQVIKDCMGVQRSQNGNMIHNQKTSTKTYKVASRESQRDSSSWGSRLTDTLVSIRIVWKSRILEIPWVRCYKELELAYKCFSKGKRWATYNSWISDGTGAFNWTSTIWVGWVFCNLGGGSLGERGSEDEIQGRVLWSMLDTMSTKIAIEYVWWQQCINSTVSPVGQSSDCT